MLRLARILKPARPRQAWLVTCDRCLQASPPISRTAAEELLLGPCLACGDGDPAYEAKLARAFAGARPYTDVN